MPVDDESLVADLRAQLLTDLLRGSDNVDILIPDDLVSFEDERAIQFILFPGERASSASRITLTIDSLRPRLEEPGVNALDWNLRFCDTNREDIAEATILECLVADIRMGESRYLVSDGDFFRVNEVFLNRLNRELEGLRHTELPLPCYRGGIEEVWNRGVAGLPGSEFVCVDGGMVRLPGESAFEAADLLHVSGALVHAKRKGRSSALGYLFLQARRSCQLLSQVPDACEQLRQLTRDAGTDPSIASRVLKALGALDARPTGLEVVLAILGDWRRRSVRSLPLLAKVDLAETMQQIALLGFNPTIALVDICGR